MQQQLPDPQAVTQTGFHQRSAMGLGSLPPHGQQQVGHPAGMSQQVAQQPMGQPQHQSMMNAPAQAAPVQPPASPTMPQAPYQSARLKPRSNAAPTPSATGNKAALWTGVFVTIALVAGAVLGSVVFNLF